MAIMQLTDTMVMPSTLACPDAGNSAYVASPSMSDMSSPESSTAALTACSACAARGTSADRVMLENPTPLTATLHRFSHIQQPPLRHCVGAGPSEALGATVWAQALQGLPLRLRLVWRQP